MALFEGYERRINQINKCLHDNGIASIEEAEKICKDKGLDVYKMVKDIQTICFENACWAYTVGAALAIKNNAKNLYICFKIYLLIFIIYMSKQRNELLISMALTV